MGAVDVACTQRGSDERVKVLVTPGRCIMWGCGKEFGVYADGRSKGRRGMCGSCYAQAIRAGDLVRVKLPYAEKVCAECGGPVHGHRTGPAGGKGVPLCKKHWDFHYNQEPERRRRNRERMVRYRARQKAQQLAKEQHELAA